MGAFDMEFRGGYLYANASDQTLSFTGPTFGNIDVAYGLDITYDASSTDSFNGWQLVGNPYTSTCYMLYIDAEYNVLDADFYKMNAAGDGFERYPYIVALAPGEGAFIKVSETGMVYIASKNKLGVDPEAEESVDDLPFLPRHGVNAFVDADLIKLADDADNSSRIVENAQANFMLEGRTLYKDGSWNTLTVPFNVTLAGTELAGATAKTLSEATINGTTISLTFGDAVETLMAGTPYIIKWNSGDDIANPVFDSYGAGDNTRIITATEASSIEKADGNVKFVGYYNPVNITAADTDIYYMKADNTLAFTGKDRTLKAFRAYFQFAEADGARTFVLDFGDGSEATSIGNLPAEMFGQGDWYTPSGVKVGDSIPTMKGVYINNGKKIVIK